MRQFARFVLALAAIIVIAACTQTPASPEYVVPLVSTAVKTDAAEVKTDSPLSSTHLTGAHEVPARPTNAQGQALIKVSDDGLSITYRLIASNIENVVASHIHTGAPGVPCGGSGRDFEDGREASEPGWPSEPRLEPAGHLTAGIRVRDGTGKDAGPGGNRIRDLKAGGDQCLKLPLG